MLTHGNSLAGAMSFHGILRPMEHRLVSLLPLSHSLEQQVSLFYAMDVGADILYVRSRNPRVIFDSLREHGVTTMLLVPQLVDLFWSAIEREVEKQGRTATFNRMRGIARHLPFGVQAPHLQERPRAAGRRPAAVRHVRRVPAAGPPAGLGGHRRHRHPGLRRHRDGRRLRHHHGRPPAGLRRRPTQTRRDANRRRRRDPVPRPHPVQGLLGQPGRNRRRLHRGRLVQVGRPGPARRAGQAAPARPQAGTSSSCPTASTCIPRTSRTACA